MKTRSIFMALVLCLAGAAVCFAQDVNMGTWKLNESKSKFTAGATKNHTVVYEAAGDNVKVTVDGTDSSGKAVHNEWTGKFDGKDYPLVGDSSADMRSYKKMDDHSMMLTNKRGGKVVLTGHIVVSADGKSRTVTTSMTDDKGKTVKNTAVYDKK